MPAEGATPAATADDLTRLYDEYGAKIYRFCLGRLRSKEDAEDAQQNTFLRVYTALRQGTVPAYEAAWIYKIAHNVCLSRIESAAARARVETPRDLAALEAELAAPSSRRDELLGLESALAELPANLRQAILLREWQGLSYTEIAEALGVSVSAVETMIFRARRRLAQTLERGVARPATRLSAALNLPWLCGRLGRMLRSLVSAGRSSLAGAAPAKLVATAAVVAVGGGGIAAGLALGPQHHRATPGEPPPSPNLAAFVATTGASHSGGPSAGPRHTPGPQRLRKVPSAGEAPEAPPVVTPGAIEANGGTTSTAGTALSPAPTEAQPAPVAAPATLPAASTQTSNEPAVTAATAAPRVSTVSTVSTVSVSTAPISTVSLPTVAISTPSVPGPVVTTPTTPSLPAPATALATPTQPAVTDAAPAAPPAVVTLPLSGAASSVTSLQLP